MTENEKAESIEVGGKVITFKEPIEVEVAKQIQADMEANEKLEGEYKLPTNMGEDIEVESIVFNKGKNDVTDTDRSMNALQDENKLLKTRLDDVNSKFDEMNSKISQISSDESKKKDDETKKAEEEKAAESKRIADEEDQKAAEAKRIADEEAKKAEEDKKAAEEAEKKKKAEEESNAEE